MALDTEKYFGEKSSQISPGSVVAFGITLDSRYGKAWEMADMLNFADKIADARLHTLFEEVFYDSKANICSFRFAPGMEPSDDEKRMIKQIASETLTQYEIDGFIGHGPRMNDFLDGE